MRTWLMAGVALMALSGCGGGQDAVGENSAGSIKTTAVGEVVANAAEPTPTPAPVTGNTLTTNDTLETIDSGAAVADNATTAH